MIQEYIQLGFLDLIYAFFLTLFIVSSGYLYKSLLESRRHIKQLENRLQEAELDRDSLMANSTLVPESDISEEETSKPETGGNITLLQQELENYLLHEEEKAQAASQNFVELSADFIDFLKVKSGKIKLKKSAFTLNDMLDDLAKSLRSQMARTGVELIFDIDPKVPPKLLGDKRYIRLLLFNLLSNIMHDRSEQQIVLHANSVKEEGKLRVYFSVDGCVLQEASDLLDTLFVPFSESPFDESVQIEFYIARELSRMMNGDVKLVEDQSGAQRVNIELLLSESDPEDKRFYRLPSRSMLGHKILIVNENKVLAKSIQSMYEYFQNEVILLLTSEFTVKPEIMREFHTVVIDKNALSLGLVEKIRAIKKSSDVNVVALLHAKDEVDYNIPVGAVDKLLIKPITIQNVFNTIIAFEEDDTSAAGRVEGAAAKQVKREIDKKVFEEFYGKRLLIIENQRSDQKLILSLLQRSGMNLSLAQNSQEGLWMLEKMPLFDIILLSSEIDKEGSIRFSQKVRNLGRYKAVPIVLIAADSRESATSGADQLMLKPLQAAPLFAVFNHYLAKEGSVAQHRHYFPKTAFVNTVSLAARDGFEMASFDESLYADILREFMRLYSDSPQTMNRALVKDDLETVKQLCLDVKGVAADIGALRLSSLTAQIHAAISKGKVKDLMAMINHYQPELDRVTNEIEAYLKG